jgi:hypothetical protein
VRTAGASAGGPVAEFLARQQSPATATPHEAGAVDAGLLDSLTRR